MTIDNMNFKISGLIFCACYRILGERFALHMKLFYSKLIDLSRLDRLDIDEHIGLIDFDEVQMAKCICTSIFYCFNVSTFVLIEQRE